MQGFADGRGTAEVLGSYDSRLDGSLNAGFQSEPLLVGVDDGKPRLPSVPRVLDGIGGLGWSVVGFVLGAVFWHFVGFWGFVSDVVLAGRPSAPMLATAQPVAFTRTADAGVADEPCIALALDRRSGHTFAAACDAGDVFPTDAFEGREDRAEVFRSAGGGIAPQAATVLGTVRR